MGWDDRLPDATERPEMTRQQKRSMRGWTFVVVALVLALVLALIPVPYVIQRPGPVFDTVGTVYFDGDEVDLIDVEGADTFPTDGTLYMLTIQVIGTPAQRPSWAEIVSAWFDPSRAVVPLETVFPGSTTPEQRAERDQIQMVSSQQDAVAAALHALDYPISQRLRIQSVSEDGPSRDVLQPGDVLMTVNSVPVDAVEGLRDGLQANGTSTPARLTIERDGEVMDVEVTPVESANGPIVGITLAAEYDLPVDVTIQLDNVGGPSAGMMFALGIIDMLTPGLLNGGQRVAGTGTITADGQVGSIGGIRQKMYGAVGAGADYFLAPAVNCNEVVGHIPDGLRVFAVSTLDDALAVLDVLRESPGQEDSLPTCS